MIATWLLFWWLILPYNLLILLCSALVPPFEAWYTKQMDFHGRQTHERILFGMFFLPCVKYAMYSFADILIAIQFTTQTLMPFSGDGRNCHRTTGIRAECPVFGSESKWDFSLVLLYIQVSRSPAGLRAPSFR